MDLELSPPIKNISTKCSYGIICWNWSREIGWQVCLVQRRLTYHFAEFVNGNYNMKDLLSLLSKMTADERVIIKSLNFNYIWYYAWQYNPEETATKSAHKNNYYNCQKIFNRNFIIKQNGKNLINAIEKTKHNNVTRVWNIPKGHKINETECDIEAAIREFNEETQISLNKIRIVPNCATYYSFIGDNSIKYKHIYFNAIYYDDKKSIPTVRDCVEIIGFNWIPLNKITLIAPELYSILYRSNINIRRHYRCNYGVKPKRTAKKNSIRESK